MEMASYLAGERWSDHPRCTHPALAALAREVNDHVDDEHRRTLVPMIPDVIGTSTEDPAVLPLLARSCALAVLENGFERHQGVAALALMRSEAALDVLAGGSGTTPLSPEAEAALDARPHAHEWARSFSGRMRRGHRPGKAPADRRATSAAIRAAVASLGPAPDGEDRMVALLRECIGICRDRTTDREAAQGVLPHQRGARY